MDSKPDFRFDYVKYRSRSLVSLSELDRLIDLALAPAAGPIQLIGTAIRLAAVGVFIFARKHILEEQERIERQEYELSRSRKNQEDLDRDDLDAKKRV